MYGNVVFIVLLKLLCFSAFASYPSVGFDVEDSTTPFADFSHYIDGLDISPKARTRLLNHYIRKKIDTKGVRTARHTKHMRGQFSFRKWKIVRSFERYDGRRWHKTMQAHHIIPLKHGGVNEWWNLTPVSAQQHRRIECSRIFKSLFPLSSRKGKACKRMLYR